MPPRCEVGVLKGTRAWWTPVQMATFNAESNCGPPRNLPLAQPRSASVHSNFAITDLDYHPAASAHQRIALLGARHRIYTDQTNARIGKNVWQLTRIGCHVGGTPGIGCHVGELLHGSALILVPAAGGHQGPGQPEMKHKPIKMAANNQILHYWISIA